MRPPLSFLGLALPLLAIGASIHDEIRFEKHVVDLGVAESCAVVDVDGDGNLDIIAGENWFQGPSWKRHHFRELKFANDYMDDFSALAVDVNEDGRPDVVSVTWFAKEIAWYENPGKTGVQWAKHVIDSGSPTEFAFLVDIDNDGRKRELLPQFGDKKAPMSWYSIEGGKFVKHSVSDRSYGHGIGAGDVNGDGRNDILTPVGWWESPANPKTGTWKHHEVFTEFEFPHLGFQFVHEVDGKGAPDVITSFAHGYGVLWMEQGAGGKWTKHMIDESWSQPHAMTLADLNADNRIDIVTGKRFHAHNGKDPGGREPLGLYWYESRAQPDGKTLWKRHLIDYGSRAGGGMQIPVVDIDRDGDLDIVTPGKSGLFLFENKTAK